MPIPINRHPGGGSLSFRRHGARIELCYLPDRLSVLRAGGQNTLGAATVINAPAMAASYDRDPSQQLGISLAVRSRVAEPREDA